jgi:hypothetical protein
MASSSASRRSSIRVSFRNRRKPRIRSRAAWYSSSSLACSGQEIARAEGEHMEHLLKTSQEKVTRRRKKSKCYFRFSFAHVRGWPPDRKSASIGAASGPPMASHSPGLLQPWRAFNHCRSSRVRSGGYRGGHGARNRFRHRRAIAQVCQAYVQPARFAGGRMAGRSYRPIGKAERGAFPLRNSGHITKSISASFPMDRHD